MALESSESMKRQSQQLQDAVTHPYAHEELTFRVHRVIRRNDLHWYTVETVVVVVVVVMSVDWIPTSASIYNHQLPSSVTRLARGRLIQPLVSLSRTQPELYLFLRFYVCGELIGQKGGVRSSNLIWPLPTCRPCTKPPNWVPTNPIQ